MAGIGGVPFSDFQDFLNHCLPHYKNKKAFTAAFEKQNHIVVDEWFGENKYQVQSGNQIEGRVILGHNGSARMVRPLAITPRNYTDVAKKWVAPWVTAQGMCNYDEQIASSFSDPSALIDYMESQFFVGIYACLDLIDDQAFVTPDNSTDDLNARGVPYWVNFLPTGTTDYVGDFDGTTVIYGDGTVDTVIGGLSKTTNPLWANWAVNYSGNVDPGALDSLEHAMIFTGFRPPKELAGYTNVKRPRRRIFSGLTHQAQYQRLRNQGPDDRNGDYRPFGFLQSLSFSSIDWVGMAVLEGQAYSPIYVLDMANFFPFVKTGWYFKRSKPMTDVEQHNFYTVFIETQFNFGCELPRNQIVMHEPF